MTVLRETVPDQYFCTKHPDLNITAREIKNQAGCPCLRRNIHLWVRANKFKFPKTMITKYCFPNLHWIHWANPWWSDSAIYSNIQVHDYNLNRVLVEQKCSFPSCPKSPFMRPTTAEVLTKATNNNHSGYSSRMCRSRSALVTSMVDVQDFGNAV